MSLLDLGKGTISAGARIDYAKPVADGVRPVKTAGLM